ncbi:hypothetical protein BGZ73_006983 [Actinomortierella ambigua]|nr:hypothetical protein BGZ73_006983 [Actinomortierella ambigua]
MEDIQHSVPQPSDTIAFDHPMGEDNTTASKDTTFPPSEEGPLLSLQITFKGAKHVVDVPASESIYTLLSRISAVTQVPVSEQKVLFKGKILRPPSVPETNDTDDHDGKRAKFAGTVPGSMIKDYPDLLKGNPKLMAMGLSDKERAQVQAMDDRVAARKKYSNPAPAVKRAAQPIRTTHDDDQYSFGRIEVLPQFTQQDKARTILERLRADLGIRGIMKQHRWQVGALIELSPAEKTILGYNRNKGELIALRLRTDDLEGFRHYDAIRKVLLHELAHNVWSEHDDRFHALNRQLNKEVQEFDWTAHGGHGLSRRTEAYFSPEGGAKSALGPDIFDDDQVDGGATTWQGGTFVLGGASGSGRRSLPILDNFGNPMTPRELAARAAQLRQLENEKDQDGLCGAK